MQGPNLYTTYVGKMPPAGGTADDDDVAASSVLTNAINDVCGGVSCLHCICHSVHGYSSQYNQFDFSKKQLNHTKSKKCQAIKRACNLIFAIQGSSSEMDPRFDFLLLLCIAPPNFFNDFHP